MRQTTTEEVRLDHGKAANFGAARPTRPPFWLLPGRLREILLSRGSQRRKIASNRLRIRGISVYYSSLMPRTYLCARLLETLD
jgi:hypothetical protein